MPLTPADTQDRDFVALAEEKVKEQPLTSAIIALLLGFVVGSVIL